MNVILERLSLRRRSGIQHEKRRRLNIASSTCPALDPRAVAFARPRMTSDAYSANFSSLIASKSCTPPPTRFVV